MKQEHRTRTAVKTELHELRETAHEKRERIHEAGETPVKVAGHPMTKADVYKFAGLIVFFVVVIAAVAVAWPYFHSLFEEGGLDLVIDRVQSAGPVGVLLLFAMQFLQIVVAFIPGEITQVAAGMLYGPWWGALIIAVGCAVSSAFVYVVVHKLGAPFVRAMVPEKYLAKFDRLEKTGKLNVIVFVLFLIPGLPKDTFTYLVPLTSMRLKTFLALTTVGRLPGIVVSTYAAHGIMDGRLVQSVVLFAVLAAIALVGVLCNERIVSFFDRHAHGGHATAAEKARRAADADVDPDAQDAPLKDASGSVGCDGAGGTEATPSAGDAKRPRALDGDGPRTAAFAAGDVPREEAFHGR